MDKNQLKDNILLKTLIMTIIIVLLVVGIAGSVFKDNHKQMPDHQIPLSVKYQNKEDIDVKIRYKYILTYKSANDEVEANIDNQQPLFTLVDEEGNILTQQYPTNNPDIAVPDVSEVITLKPDEVILANLEVKVSDAYKDIQDKILFETFIVVEEIIEGKWSPVYQVRLMERGNYYRLEKLPVEKFE